MSDTTTYSLGSILTPGCAGPAEQRQHIRPVAMSRANVQIGNVGAVALNCRAIK